MTSIERIRGGSIAYESDVSPSSYMAKIKRAHGNSAEYVGLLIGLFLVVGFIFPGESFTPLMSWVIIAVAASRFVHALGFLMSSTLEKIHLLKATGLTLTYFGAGFLAIKCLASLLS